MTDCSLTRIEVTEWVHTSVEKIKENLACHQEAPSQCFKLSIRTQSHTYQTTVFLIIHSKLGVGMASGGARPTPS